MNLYIDNNELRIEFKQKLKWFEEEFDLIFKNKMRNYTREEKKLAYSLLNKLSETINEYPDETLISPLVSTLNAIEKKYPEFF